MVCYLSARGGTEPRWYKFDDGEVSECKMEDDEELKSQCFGGEYIGEVFDHMLKRCVQYIVCTCMYMYVC